MDDPSLYLHNDDLKTVRESDWTGTVFELGPGIHFYVISTNCWRDKRKDERCTK